MIRKLYLKQKLLLTLLAACALSGLQAQIVTVPSGNTDGTGAGTTSSVRKPYGCFFGYERTALIYLSSEVNTTGTITSVGFYVNAITSPASSTPVKIYLKETSTSDFTSSGTNIATEFSGATLVYTGNVLATELVPGSWITKTLTTPFNYSGTNNLEVLVEANYGGGGGEGTTDKAFRYDSTGIPPNYRMEYWIQDNSPPTDNGSPVYYRTNVQFNFTPSVACAGTPTAGTTTADASTVCATQDLNLSLTGSSTDVGLSYQWISSTDGINYTEINGANSSTYTTTQSTATYYRNIVTCSNSSASDTSTALLVGQTVCYCQGTSSCSSGDEIDTVIFAGINNYTSCTTGGYSSYTSQTAAVQQSTSVPISVYATDGGQESVYVWIDYDHSGTFDATEFTNLGTQAAGGVFFNGNISIPMNAMLGVTSMRVRLRYGSTILTGDDACLDYSYGETEDYLVDISAAPACTIPPVGGTATGPAAGEVDSLYTYILTGSTGAIQWQYSTSSASGPYADITGSTDDTLQVIFNGAATFWIRALLTSPGCPSDSSNAVQVAVTKPGNNVCDAIPLVFGTNGPFSTVGANTETGEPAPPGYDCHVQDGWCEDSTITNTLWFTFVAPASGRVRIQSPGFDTQLALWDAADCNAVLNGGATLINANDDDADYSANGVAQFSSIIDSAICLTPGKTYFVQLDPYSEPGDVTTIVLTDLGAGPDASFTGLASGYCVTAPDVTLTPAVAGGTFSGTGISGSTFSPATAGLGGPYTITYSLYACYSSTDTVTINNGPSIDVTTVTPVQCNGGSDGAIDVTILDGSGNYTFAWSNSETSEDISNLSPGNYTLTLTDNSGNCSAVSSAITITEPTALVPAFDSLKNVTCNGGSNGGIYISVSGGTTPYSFTWSDNSHNEDLTNAPAGSYTATVTDDNGCSLSSPAPITISEPSAIVITVDSTHSSFCGATDGALYITVSGGTPGYSYLWSNTAITEDITGLVATSYTVTVTDANMCTASGTGTVPNGTSLSLTSSITGVACNGGTNGAVDITITGGSGSYTYSWSNTETTEDISGLSAGNYTVTVDDDNSNCSLVSSGLVVTEPDAVSIATDSTHNATCFGSTNGAVYITVSGGTQPYGFVWSDNSQNEDLTGVGAGNYMTTVTDDNGCSASSSSATITEPSELVVTTDSVHNNACFGETDGAVYTTVSGGTSPYSPMWSNSATTEDITGLAAGNYTVTVSDDNSCSTTVTATVTEGAQILATLDSVKNVACFGESNGAVYTTLSGGTGNLSIVWSNTATTDDLTNLAAGTFTVTVTDGNMCTASVSATVTAPSAALAASSVSTDQNQGSNNGAVNVTITGGTTPYTSLWSNNATTEDLTGLTAGIYSVTITDAGGCTVSLSDTVSLITGISNLQNAFGVDVFPNPTQDKVFVTLTLTTAGRVSIELYNIEGQLIREIQDSNVLNARYELNFTTEAAGVYFAKIQAGDATVTKRIVVAK